MLPFARRTIVGVVLTLLALADYPLILLLPPLPLPFVLMDFGHTLLDAGHCLLQSLQGAARRSHR